MTPKISNADLVLVRKSIQAEDGNIVVCVNKGESMVKVFRRAPNGEIILSSLNQKAEYAPLVASRQDFRVEGVVVGVISYSMRGEG